MMESYEKFIYSPRVSGASLVPVKRSEGELHVDGMDDSSLFFHFLDIFSAC